MARVQTWLAISFLAVTAIGCVPSEQYRAMQMDRDQLASRLAVAENAKNEAAAERDLLKSQLDKVGLGDNQKDALILNQSNQLSELQRTLAELNEKYGRAVANVGQTVLLPAPLNDALKAFAAQNSDLITYDENRGIVKFKSDVTFSPGSAVLTSSAASVIDRFASILNSPAAAGYELMVVGHTDNVHVANPETLRQGHKDNWYLSAHRAIAVSSELRKQSVSGTRLEVAGWADQRPIAANTTDAGRAQNRRVEVLILPAAPNGATAEAPSSGSAIQARNTIPKTAPLNKDTANKDAPATPSAPHLNK